MPFFAQGTFCYLLRSCRQQGRNNEVATPAPPLQTEEVAGIPVANPGPTLHSLCAHPGHQLQDRQPRENLIARSEPLDVVRPIPEVT